MDGLDENPAVVRGSAHITERWRLQLSPAFAGLFAGCQAVQMAVNAEDHVRKMFFQPRAGGGDRPDILPVERGCDRIAIDLGHLEERMVDRTLFHPGRTYKASATDGVVVVTAVPIDY